MDFPFENQTFKLTVTAAVSPISSGSGNCAAFFLGGKELGRVNIPIAARDLNH